MCGIAGVIGLPREQAVAIAQKMLAALRHRGPDGEGLEVVEDPLHSAPPIVLVHTRLAVLDLSPAGRQPMRHQLADAPPVWITFNGEVYNYRHLLTVAQQRGLVPQSSTDTEAILLAYRLWGENWVEQLRGMFAFALVDVQHRQVWLVRDRLGIKPLYVFEPATGGLLFASEVRALLAAGPAVVPRCLALASIESFLAQGAVYGYATHVQGIRLLAPATVWQCGWEGRLHRHRCYWSWPVAAAGLAVRERMSVVAQLHQQLREAVQQHLVADVPVGIFLSSGIDSTTVATVATEVCSNPIRTITVGFDHIRFDETQQAAQIARQLGTEHHTIRVHAADVYADFEGVLNAVDQPTVDGFNTYYVSRAARQAGVTVALSGLGGDELFGGYATFHDVPRALRVQQWLRRLPAVNTLVRVSQRWWNNRTVAKLVELTRRSGNLTALYLLRRELFLPAERRALLPLPEGCDPQTGLSLTDWTIPEGLDPENSISYLEMTGYLRHVLLKDTDVFSMVHALELRVPLLDHELVTAVALCPGRWKRPLANKPKPLLIEAAGARFPSWISRNPKRGFTFPWTYWFKGALLPLVQDRLLQPQIWKRIGFCGKAVATLWRRFQSGDPSVIGLQILALLVLADVVERQGLSLP
jgi:asparagine synthase (glutamine-hydrolysing)